MEKNQETESQRDSASAVSTEQEVGELTDTAAAAGPSHPREDEADENPRGDGVPPPAAGETPTPEVDDVEASGERPASPDPGRSPADGSPDEGSRAQWQWPSRTRAFWIFLILVLLFAAKFFGSVPAESTEVSYIEYRQYLKDRQIVRAEIVQVVSAEAREVHVLEVAQRVVLVRHADPPPLAVRRLVAAF